MFDTPVFKILARNDTGAAPGHQGGIVIPKEIENFFPDVEGDITPEAPTADVAIIADLLLDGRFIARVNTRYQYQTWGGTRSPERRLTGGLGPIRDLAQPDDVVLFSRDPLLSERMTISLLRHGTAEHDFIVRSAGKRRWGTVPNQPKPVGNLDIREAEDEISRLSAGTFSPFDNDRKTIETSIKRKARSAAFRKKLMQIHGPVCAASGELISTPAGLVNLDAAHIVPVELGGTDDVRNGLLLSKDIHWALDNGLITISDSEHILISSYAKKSSFCEILKRIDGRKLEFKASSIRPHSMALKWHRENRFIG